MKGTILSYSTQNQTGEILSEEQLQYTFSITDWFETAQPTVGTTVNFELDANGLVTKITAITQPVFTNVSNTPLQKQQHNEEDNYNMFNWFVKCLKNYANFKDRARRKEYWFFTLVYILATIICAIIDGILWSYPILTILFLFAMIIPNYSVLARRLHDINKSGWAMFISMIPIVGGIILLVWLCTETKNEDNQWGKPAK